ncbi:mediator complex subunit [Conoideocrella luteorostrata]|uniref:Mediator of RNA polymerase II transcription subunit 14 n=1 Tax=Conoideocrella luteorostrata TaxID=1105319 RepID=A0AAJ0CF65_9HYPO|nr:mediator complex subunit [Conoideocrella luteorostrata]
MEPSGQNGTRTDHDRDFGRSDVNGAIVTDPRHAGLAKEKATAAVTPADNEPNALTGKDESRRHEAGNDEAPEQNRNRMNDLPDSIEHVTQGFVDLSLLFTRMAQVTHNALHDKVAELAKMPLPATAMNGTSSYSSTGPDDTSADNLRKKGNLLHFAQEWHGKWLKALVIAEWSRQSQDVSKLIDLKFHIDQQRILYDAALDNIVNVKRDLIFARMPSPDLKTALQVLSTGSAPWIPDHHYIEPPALTAEEQLTWMNTLDTLLSIRLNLDDFDKIPPQFRNYKIGSGRVTFKVKGEFEVDLTIADEDFEKQFWFIDFRYAFTPVAALSLPESLRSYLEGCVNDVLKREGLEGCYKFLHEFVLTSKINELKRQALQLGRTSWTGTLNVEPLNRALAIQYWTSRSVITGSKSWILIGVNSNRKPNSKQDATTSSQLVTKWYRDGKEVKEVDLEFNVDELSAGSLLTNVIARHVEHILGSIHEKLLTAARFRNREAGMVLQISKTDPAFSVLTTQVGYNEKISLLVEPMTGMFAVKPQSKITIQPEHHLNNGKNPSEDGVTCLEHVRCAILEDEIQCRGTLMGWYVRKPAMKVEDLKSVTKKRDCTRAIWLQKDGWGPSWFVVMVLGSSGDELYLLESNRNETSKPLPFLAKRLPLSNGYPELANSFWDNLAFLTTGMITQLVDQRELHRLKIKSKLTNQIVSSALQNVQMPSIDIALSALFPAMVFNKDKAGPETSSSENNGNYDNREVLSLIQRASGVMAGPKKAWADDTVNISFRGIEALSVIDGPTNEGSQENELLCTCEAIIKVRNPSKFASLTGLADRDVSYNPLRGQFSLRIQRAVGRPILDALMSRIKAIDRFVNFLEAMDSAKGTIRAISATLRQITFDYGSTGASQGQEQQGEEGQNQEPPKRWRVILDLSGYDIDIEIETGNPHLRLVDLMRQLVNSDGGIGALMSWLPASLHALEAIGKMETQWEPLLAAGHGRFELSMKTIAWMTIDYKIKATGSKKVKPKIKTVSLQIKMQSRRGQSWWHVWRSDADSNTNDTLSKALQPIWDGKGEDWLGLSTGAAGRPQGGVMALLLAVDEAIRKSVTDGLTLPG